MNNFHQTGTACDLAAVKVNWSRRTAEKAAQVLAAVEDHAAADASMQDVEEHRSTLNKRSINAAYQKAVEFGWIDGVTDHREVKRGHAITAVVKVAAIFKGETW